MDTVFEGLDPATAANCWKTYHLLVHHLGPRSAPYVAVHPDADLDPEAEGADIAVFYAGPDDDDGPIATDRLADLTHVPLDVFDFTLTVASMTGVPMMLVARLDP
jgi:hypothetical protein